MSRDLYPEAPSMPRNPAPRPVTIDPRSAPKLQQPTPLPANGSPMPSAPPSPAVRPLR